MQAQKRERRRKTAAEQPSRACWPLPCWPRLAWVSATVSAGPRRHDQLRWVVVGSTVGFALFGVIAVRGAARQVARLSEPRAGIGNASALHLAVLDLRLHPGPSRTTPAAPRQSGRGLLVAGAATGVILGIAAQHTLGSFFAGPVLLFARPYVLGQQVTVHSGALGGPFASTITDAGLLYTTLITSTCRDPTAQQRTARSPHRTSNRPDARRRPTDRCR